MRLGVTEPDGTPLVHPVWYTWERDQFLLHIPTRSPKRMAIEAQPTVYFTVDDKGPSIFGGAKPEQPLIPIGSGCVE
jgi:nitroimidazol reductase NimA-like FMN-containing flavoprotein (pyridoxamine 5'-phosphate oxidase superfamily)